MAEQTVTYLIGKDGKITVEVNGVKGAACRELGGRPLSGADIGWEIPVFQELSIALLFWAGDEEFSPQIRYLWDENALAYIRYETMYYVLDWLRTRLDLK